jgi:BirA family biotin operon repressor/biotin-[acetyl-CoA-carboxylase] ligase
METEAHGFASIRPAYEGYLALKGKRVTVVEVGSRVAGIVEGIDADGALLLSTEAGTNRVMSGDVTVEGAYD